jgi:hypothetical protein
MACDQFASFCPSDSQVIFQQSPDGRYYDPINDSCILQANDGSLLAAHRAISLLRSDYVPWE